MTTLLTSHFALWLGMVIFSLLHFKNYRQMQKLKKARENVLRFSHLYFRFIVEPNFLSKSILAQRLIAESLKRHPFESETVLGFLDTKHLTNYLDNVLVQFLLDCTHGMNIKKTTEVLSEHFKEIYGTEYECNGGVKRMMSLLSEKSDFGFLKTLEEIYGSETTDSAIAKFESTYEAYNKFMDSYPIERYSIHNNFYSINKEINERGSSLIKAIINEWIKRGGRPSEKYLKELQFQVDTGY